MMHALRRGADNDDDPATQAAADPKPPINLKDVLAAATEHAVVTEALKRAILDMSSQFGLNIVDDNLITDKEVRASRLSKHVGCNGRRLVRQKIPMARPRELPVGVPLLRLQGARDREHTQDANRKAAISVFVICALCKYDVMIFALAVI